MWGLSDLKTHGVKYPTVGQGRSCGGLGSDPPQDHNSQAECLRRRIRGDRRLRSRRGGLNPRAAALCACEGPLGSVVCPLRPCPCPAPEPWSDISDISDICPRTLSDTPDTCPRTPSDTPDMCPRTHRTLRTPLDAYGCPKCPKCPRTLRTHRTQPFTITESRCVLRSVEVICRGYSCMCPSFLAAS